MTIDELIAQVEKGHEPDPDTGSELARCWEEKCYCHDRIMTMIAEIKRLRKELKDADDYIQYLEQNYKGE